MSQTQGATPTQNFQRGKGETNVNEKERGKDVRYSNIEAAKGKNQNHNFETNYTFVFLWIDCLMD